MVVLWVVAPCSLVEIYRQGKRPDDGGSKHVRNVGGLHGATTQKKAIFIVTTWSVVKVVYRHFTTN
jgi:hypothetical protein